MPETDFVQPGETTACGHCEPEKYMAVLPCECNCHKALSPKKEGWEEQFDEKFGGGGYPQAGGVVLYTHAHEARKEFIRSLLASQKEKILAEIEGLRKIDEDPYHENIEQINAHNDALDALKAKIELI